MIVKERQYQEIASQQSSKKTAASRIKERNVCPELGSQSSMKTGARPMGALPPNIPSPGTTRVPIVSDNNVNNKIIPKQKKEKKVNPFARGKLGKGKELGSH